MTDLRAAAEQAVIAMTAYPYDDKVWRQTIVPAMDALTAALRAPVAPAVPAWQPIETAPKNVDHMLLSDGARVSLGGWISDIEHGAEYEGQIGMAGWWAVDLGPNNDRPTHWMPLPAAPTKETT